MVGKNSPQPPQTDVGEPPASAATTQQRQVEAMLERFNYLIERTIAVNSAPKKFGTDAPLFRAEIHTVQAIGNREGLNMTELADRMNVTKGAASQMVKKLEAKGLVQKRGAPGSRREVELGLTPLGWRAHHEHEQFHAQMFTAVQGYFGDSIETGVASVHAALVDLIGLVDTFDVLTGSSSDPDS